MPTDAQRLAALVKSGLLPETAQDIVDGSLTEMAPEVNRADQARVATWTLFSPLVPEWMRGLFIAEDIPADTVIVD